MSTIYSALIFKLNAIEIRGVRSLCGSTACCKSEGNTIIVPAVASHSRQVLVAQTDRHTAPQY